MLMQIHLFCPFSGYITILKELAKWKEDLNQGCNSVPSVPWDWLLRGVIWMKITLVFIMWTCSCKELVGHWMYFFKTSSVQLNISLLLRFSDFFCLPLPTCLVSSVCLSLLPQLQDVLLVNTDMTWTKVEILTIAMQLCNWSVCLFMGFLFFFVCLFWFFSFWQLVKNRWSPVLKRIHVALSLSSPVLMWSGHHPCYQWSKW